MLLVLIRWANSPYFKEEEWNKLKITLMVKFFKMQHKVKERLINYVGSVHNLGLSKSSESFILFFYSISASPKVTIF